MHANDTIVKHFGKYSNQFMEFQSWPIQAHFFTSQQSWTKLHSTLEPFDYLKYSEFAP